VRRIVYSLIVAGLVLVSQKIVAQDPHFSQYYANPLYLNPAMTGLDSDVYFGLNYRSQWKSLDLPLEIAQFTMVYPLLEKGSQFKHRGGLGMSVYHEMAGEANNFQTTSYTVSGAYNLFLKDDASQMISVGIQGGFITKRINFNNLRWGSQYDPFIGFDANITPSLDLGNQSTTFPVIHVGVVWYFDHEEKRLHSGVSGFIGFAASNLNQPDESLLDETGTESPLPTLYKAHGGLNLNMSRQLTISPNILYMRQHNSQQLNAGMYLTYQVLGPRSRTNKLKMQLGTWYRFDDAFIVSLGMTNKNMSFGFSYDFNNSTLRNFTGGNGAIEASISYRIVQGKGLRRFSTPLL
jgi:type IX secretion system PorP/SprF family membrane protein